MNGLDSFFKIKERDSTISKELIGGIITFFSMVYILAVHPGIMSAAGMDFGRMFTSTAIAAGVATLVMALIGRLPIALAPGLGINAFIAFAVCGAMGWAWQTAIVAVFVVGVISIIISVSGLRKVILDSIPVVLRKGVALGIGFFIAIIGLSNAGLLVVGGGTPLALGNIHEGAPLVAIVGLVAMIVLYTLRVPGGIFIAIIIATIFGRFVGVTSSAEGILVAPYTPADVVSGFAAVNIWQFLVVVISLIFVDMFDTISTFAGIVQQTGGKLQDSDGQIINSKNALLCDSIGTTFGSLVGATSTTSYIESSTGVASGARTGLASVVTAVLFFLAIPFYPLFALIPSAAVAPALIFVGFLMLGSLSKMDLTEIDSGLPIFITVLIMVASYSISQGLAWGFVAYILTKVCLKKWQDISPATWVLGVIFLLKIIFIPI